MVDRVGVNIVKHTFCVCVYLWDEVLAVVFLGLKDACRFDKILTGCVGS